MKGSNGPVQVGIVSYGKGCGETSPGVYARISAERDWVKKTSCNLNPRAGFCGGSSISDGDGDSTIIVTPPSPTPAPPRPTPRPPGPTPVPPQCGDTRDCSEIKSAWFPSLHCGWDFVWGECDRTCCRCGDNYSWC